MNKHRIYKVKLKILTPVHIGSGEKISSWEFVKQNNTISLYDVHKFFTKITPKLNMELINRVKEYLSQRKSLRNYAKDFGFKKEFEDARLYSLYVEETAGRTSSYYLPFIKTNGMAYIPGSELKGALRTAVVASILKADNRLVSEIKEELNKIKGGSEIKTKLKDITERLEEQIFRSKILKGLHSDWFKVIKISDSSLAHPEGCLFVSIPYILSSRQEKGDFEEYLSPQTEFSCIISFGYAGRYLSEFKNKIHMEKDWIQSPDVLIKKVLSYAYDFSNLILKKEKEYFKDKKGYEEIIELIDKLEKENQPESPLVRIGKDTGYISHTVGYVLKEIDQDLAKKFFTLMKENIKQYERINPDNFPKTRKVVRYKGKMYLLGWIKIKVEKKE